MTTTKTVRRPNERIWLPSAIARLRMVPTTNDATGGCRYCVVNNGNEKLSNWRQESAKSINRINKHEFRLFANMFWWRAEGSARWYILLLGGYAPHPQSIQFSINACVCHSSLLVVPTLSLDILWVLLFGSSQSVARLRNRKWQRSVRTPEADVARRCRRRCRRVQEANAIIRLLSNCNGVFLFPRSVTQFPNVPFLGPTGCGR